MTYWKYRDPNPITKIGWLEVSPLGRRIDVENRLNEAAEEIRSNRRVMVSGPRFTGYTAAINLRLLPGYYEVGSVNWTNLQNQELTIDARGAVIVGTEPGKAVVDLLGSRFVNLVGLTVVGDQSAIPREGIQIGRTGEGAIGNNRLESCTAFGSFSSAALYNVASEITQFVQCRWQNDQGSGLCYIGDGRNHFGVQSDYADITIAQPEEMSFTHNKHYGCEYRHYGDGDCAWLSSSRGHEFDKGCYFLTWDKSSVRLWSTNVSRHRDLTLHGSFETSQAPGLKQVVEFEGDGTATALDGLDFRANNLQCSGVVFKTTNTGQVNLTAASIVGRDLEIGGAKWFDGPNKLAYVGSIAVDNQGQLNTGDLVSFAGDVWSNTGVTRT